MTLEALGKTGADYKHKALLGPIAEVFEGEIDDRAKDKESTDLSGLRLPTW